MLAIHTGYSDYCAGRGADDGPSQTSGLTVAGRRRQPVAGSQPFGSGESVRRGETRGQSGRQCGSQPSRQPGRGRDVALPQLATVERREEDRPPPA